MSTRNAEEKNRCRGCTFARANYGPSARRRELPINCVLLGRDEKAGAAVTARASAFANGFAQHLRLYVLHTRNGVQPVQTSQRRCNGVRQRSYPAGAGSIGDSLINFISGITEISRVVFKSAARSKAHKDPPRRHGNRAAFPQSVDRAGLWWGLANLAKVIDGIDSDILGDKFQTGSGLRRTMLAMDGKIRVVKVIILWATPPDWNSPRELGEIKHSAAHSALL
jgi:hypothetical protein